MSVPRLVVFLSCVSVIACSSARLDRCEQVLESLESCYPGLARRAVCTPESVAMIEAGGVEGRECDAIGDLDYLDDLGKVDWLGEPSCGDDEHACGFLFCCADGDLDDSLPGAWERRVPVPDRMQENAVVSVDGLIYVIGGLRGPKNKNQVWIYDPVADAWSAGPVLPRGFHHPNAAVVGGRIYIAGMLDGLFQHALGAVYALDPTTDAEWTLIAQMPAGAERGSSAVGVIGTRIFLAGGLRGRALNDGWSYDTATGQWAALPVLPEALDHAVGAVVDDRLYVIGGRDTLVWKTSDRVYELDEVARTWRQRSAMPTARGGAAAGVIDGRIVVAGGEGNSILDRGVFSAVEIYDPAADHWEVVRSMKTPRHGTGGAVVDGALYVPAGADFTLLGAVDANEVLVP